MDFEIKRKNGLYSIIAYLIIFNLLAYFVYAIVDSVFKGLNIDLTIKENAYIATSIVNLLIYAILIVALLLISHKELLGEVKTFFKDKKDNIFFKIIAAYGIFYAINLFFNVVIQNIEINANLTNIILGNQTSITSTADNQNIIEKILHSNGFIFMFLSAGILGPICEELVFRKALFNVCKTKEMGILLSSLCFGLIHITSSLGQYDLLSMILMTIPYIASGIAFGIIYIKNDCNIVVPTIVHMLSNIISMVGILMLA